MNEPTEAGFWKEPAVWFWIVTIESATPAIVLEPTKTLFKNFVKE